MNLDQEVGVLGCVLTDHLSVRLFFLVRSDQISSIGRQFPNSRNREKEKKSGRQSFVGVLNATWVHSALTLASSRSKVKISFKTAKIRFDNRDIWRIINHNAAMEVWSIGWNGLVFQSYTASRGDRYGTESKWGVVSKLAQQSGPCAGSRKRTLSPHKRLV